MPEPWRKHNINSNQGANKIRILAPSVYQILDDDFSYGEYAEKVTEALYRYHKTGVYQGILEDLNDVDLSDFFDGKPKPPEGKYAKIASEATKIYNQYYEQSIYALQQKFEYNLIHGNTDMKSFDAQITNAMIVMTVDFFRKQTKVYQSCKIEPPFELTEQQWDLIDSGYADALLLFLNEKQDAEDLTLHTDGNDFESYGATEMEKALSLLPITEIVSRHRNATQSIVEVMPEEPIENTYVGHSIQFHENTAPTQERHIR